MKNKSSNTSNHEQSSLSVRITPGDSVLMLKEAKRKESDSISLSPKKKRILKKPQSLLGRLKLQSPLSFPNVHSIFNIIGLNDSALRNPESEQSYFKTMFYLRAVERAELRRHALILQLRPTDLPQGHIQYLINRYKSFGELKFYQLALALERLSTKLGHNAAESFMQQLMRSFDGEPLSRFIDSMAGEVYMCKVAPNKLVISRGLLELLGEDPETYAIEVCKYRAPLREIISAQRYLQIMTRTVDNLGLLCDFISGDLSHDQLHAKTSLNFNDYIIDRHHKRIQCNFVLFMPTPQISCIQMRQIIKQSDHHPPQCPIAKRKKQMIDELCQQRRFSEAQTLKNLVKLPQGMLKDNQKRMAGYRQMFQQKN